MRDGSAGSTPRGAEEKEEGREGDEDADQRQLGAPEAAAPVGPPLLLLLRPPGTPPGFHIHLSPSLSAFCFLVQAEGMGGRDCEGVVARTWCVERVVGGEVPVLTRSKNNGTAPVDSRN